MLIKLWRVPFFQGMTDKLDFLDGDQKGPAAASQKTKSDAAKKG